jgi:hypothetical protein
LNNALIMWRLCQKGDPPLVRPRRTVPHDTWLWATEAKEACYRLPLISIRQIHLVISATFISLVFTTPSPPWSLGLQMSSHATKRYFFLFPSEKCLGRRKYYIYYNYK